MCDVTLLFWISNNCFNQENLPQKETNLNFTHFSGFCLFIGNLNSNKDFDEIKASLRKFFEKNELDVADVRLGGSK